MNFYPDNQFTIDGATVARGDPGYRPLSRMLMDVARRYGRPMIVSETGAEGTLRAPWLRYVASECLAAMDAGCELHGITLYPVLNHPGWADDRPCENGLWDRADARGARAVHRPLLAEMRRQAPRLVAGRDAVLGRGAP